MDQNNKQPQPQQGSAFGSFPQQKPAGFSSKEQESSEVLKRIAEIASSVRILEDRYLNLRKKSQLTDQNLIELQKDYFKEKKHLNQELVETKMKINELDDSLNMMQNELKDVVKQKDLKVISKYLDFWEPTQFITRKEVEKLLKEE